MGAYIVALYISIYPACAITVEKPGYESSRSFKGISLTLEELIYMPADSECVGFFFLCEQLSDKFICLFETDCKSEIVFLSFGDISQCVLRCRQLLVFEAVYTGIPKICEQCRRILFHEGPQAEPFCC